MSKNSTYDKIEAYLTGQLSESESLSFEQQIQNDDELAAALAFQQLEHQAMDKILENDLKDKMTKWDDTPPPNPFEETLAIQFTLEEMCDFKYLFFG